MAAAARRRAAVAAIDGILGGDLPILALTSQIQLRHLLDVAGLATPGAVSSALNTLVLVGAVGPTCAAACHDAGIDTMSSFHSNRSWRRCLPPSPRPQPEPDDTHPLT